MSMPHSALSRRTLLRGLGCTMALPWLESFPLLAREETAAAHPKRFAALFMGNGVNSRHWWAKGHGAAMELGKSLEPLQPFRTRLNVISGLFNKSATGVGIHPGQTGNILSGAATSEGRGASRRHQRRSGPRRIASPMRPPQPSLVLGCEQPITGYHETNFSMAYSSHISWQDADSPVPMEVYPSLAFDSLFDNQGSQRTLSILDRVKDQAAALEPKVSSTDKAKLDEYLTSVREVEKRVEKTRGAKDEGGWQRQTRPRDEAARQRPARGHSRAHAAHVRHHRARLPDRQDARRHAPSVPRPVRPLLPLPRTSAQAHHPASHDDLSDAYERVTRYYVGHLAYLAGKLAAMKEGDSTVLDNSCLLFVSNMWSGSKHDSSKLPLLLVGGLGGKLETGRVLDYRDERRRQAQALRPLPVHHESHGRERQKVRRCDGAPRGPVILP